MISFLAALVRIAQVRDINGRRSPMEQMSDIDIQSLHSALSVALLSSQPLTSEGDVGLPVTSESALDMDMDHLLSVFTAYSDGYDYTTATWACYKFCSEQNSYASKKSRETESSSGY